MERLIGILAFYRTKGQHCITSPSTCGPLRRILIPASMKEGNPSPYSIGIQPFQILISNSWLFSSTYIIVYNSQIVNFPFPFPFSWSRAIGQTEFSHNHCQAVYITMEGWFASSFEKFRSCICSGTHDSTACVCCRWHN